MVEVVDAEVENPGSRGVTASGGGTRTTPVYRLAGVPVPPAQRREMFDKLIRHLSEGFSPRNFPDASEEDLESMVGTWPEFCTEGARYEIGRALRTGKLNLEKKGFQLMDFPGGASVWKTFAAHYLGLHDRVEVAGVRIALPEEMA